MMTSGAILSILAVVGVAFAKSVDSSAVLSLPQSRIFEKEVLEKINELKDKLKKYDPFEEKNVEFNHAGYKVTATDVFAVNFSDFEVTDLKISILRKIEATIRLPALALRVGPFEASTPHGDVFSTGVNYADSNGGTVSFKATIDLTPTQVNKLSFTLKLEDTSVDLNGINDDDVLTARLNREANKFLTTTINDPKWQKGFASEIEEFLNYIISQVLG